ncbi:acyl-CoA dehydrogenase [Penicillium samsonianum]|uniref:acyl-CoA dehydrogenase n=1 Tax=Penicillium samsonianum TaxID=1882272 RepID=UPI002546EACF|nr:acyl-CoA dehydrogenase [Penicillium samsonianum]KAJ6128096.1 acyl-CoA dehydrogenase [Penicillium samsonianum]
MCGVGYMDESEEPEFNISHLYRDTAVILRLLPSGETTNVSELVRHLFNGDKMGVFRAWLDRVILEVL